jgi:hypothetical protein
MRSRLKALWSEIALKVKDSITVAGYDLLDEPYSQTDQQQARAPGPPGNRLTPALQAATLVGQQTCPRYGPCRQIPAIAATGGARGLAQP